MTEDAMSEAPGMVELLPCPFCGGEADIDRIGDRRRSTIYRCGHCSCSLETGEEWDHGRDWNTRADLAIAQARAAWEAGRDAAADAANAEADALLEMSDACRKDGDEESRAVHLYAANVAVNIAADIRALQPPAAFPHPETPATPEPAASGQHTGAVVVSKAMVSRAVAAFDAVQLDASFHEVMRAALEAALNGEDGR